MDNIFKDVISSALYQATAKLLIAKIPFSIIIDNHNNWNNEFPERLKKQKQIIFNIKEQSLDDSYVTDGKIIIIISIDDVEYMKELQQCDLQALMINEKSPHNIAKMFVDHPEVNLKRGIGDKSIPSDEALIVSNVMWKKHNPELFEEN